MLSSGAAEQAAVGEEYIGEFGRQGGMCVHAEEGDGGGGSNKPRT